MMDFYYFMMNITIGMSWFAVGILLIAIWALWAVHEVSEEEIALADGRIITTGDIIFATFVLIIGGGVLGFFAGVLCPIMFPILCVIYAVYGFKLYIILKS